jgi:hypothetical protein
MVGSPMLEDVAIAFFNVATAALYFGVALSVHLKKSAMVNKKKVIS